MRHPQTSCPKTNTLHWLCAHLALLLALTVCARQAGAQAVDLAPLRNGNSIVNHMQVLKEQPGPALQIDDLAALEDWVPATPDSLPSILRRSTLWLTALVGNDSATPITRWLAVGYWRLNDVQLFLVDPHTNAVLSHMRGGLAHPRSELDLPLPTMKPVFPVELEPGQQLRLVLRVHSNGWRTIDVDAWAPFSYITALNLAQAAHSAIGGVGLAVVLILLLARRSLYWLLAAWLALTLAFATVNLGYGVPWLSQLLPAGKLSALVAALAVWSGVPMVLATGMILGAHRKVFWRRALAGVVIVGALGSVSLFFVSGQWLRPLVATLMIALLVVWPPLALFARHKKQHIGVLLPTLLTLSWMLLAVRLLSYMTAVLVEYERVLYAASLYGQIAILLLIIGKAALLQRSREMRIERWLKESRLNRRKKLARMVHQRTDQLEQSVLAAQEANRAKTEFLGHASHDLRSPLATIVGYTQMLQAKASSKDVSTELAVIRRTADHMLNVIDDLVDYARNAGKDRIDPQPVYTAWLIDAIAPQAQALACANRNHFSLTLRTAMPPVIVADSGRLRRILINLLDNAAKFTHHGQITLSVECAPATDPGHVRMQFTVSDTGCGIQPEDQERVLEPFFRARSSHGTPGVGLGMRIVSIWVQRMGGRLHIKSEPGQGTDVTVDLSFPVSDESQIRSPEPLWPLPQVNGQGRQIWIVEDVPEVRNYLADMLKRHGFAVAESPDGAAFIQAMRAPGTVPPSAVLTDYFMPGANGDAVLNAVREQWPGVPVLLLSADITTLPDSSPTCIELFDACLPKPVDSTDLCNELTRLLGLSPLASTSSIDKPPVAANHNNRDGYEAPAAHGPDALATVMAHRATPPENQLAELAHLVDMGALTDIEEWANTLIAEAPEHTPFAHEVNRLAETLNLQALHTLIASNRG